MILSLSGSPFGVKVVVVKSEMSEVLSSVQLSLQLRCCLFLRTGPEGVSTR